MVVINKLLFLSGFFLLCTVFAIDTSLANGLVMGKVNWFHLSMLLLALCSLVATLLSKQINLPNFSIMDGGIIVLAVIVAFTYDWTLNPEPEKMLLGGQFVILWFLLRFLFSGWPQLKMFFLMVIVMTGLVEACLGIRQLYGWESSNHSLFKITGDFYNPGPYSGYLAIALPICLCMILRHVRRDLCFFAWIAFLVIIVVLPAGMSRTAWIAATVSCIWVYWSERIGLERVKQYIRTRRTPSIILFILILISTAGTLTGIYILKEDSANGRFLLWKVTGRAIMERPLLGTGLGGFPAAYAKAQATYFSSGEASETEKIVAGCPEYGFQEFLQIGLEQGLIGLIIFVLLLGYSLFQGLKNRQTGAVGGILALTVFCLASYPLQLPEFWVVLVVLMGIVSSSSSDEKKRNNKILSVAAMSILVTCCGVFSLQQKKFYPKYKKWNMLKVIYNNKAYEAAVNGYMELIPYLKHKPELLFEASQCLSKTGHFAEANLLLKRATQLSSDPMILYMAAKNEESQGNYKKAECLLLHAIEILPERVYPYYLLVKLYEKGTFFQKDKLFKTIDIVLKKEPKVESSAIREMKTEVKRILKSTTEESQQ